MDHCVEDVLARIAVRRPKLIDLSLDRMVRVLQRLGNPQNRLPPVFHIAGTNGKGSTAAFLRSILEAAGHSVHLYTSPHLVRFNERIRLAGVDISDAALIDALERCDAAGGEDSLTYFETTTCAAFVAMADISADFTIIEVGLGGRLDATNVIETPLATLVTPVDFDHEQFLGDTIEAIASEKAGIFRSGIPAVIGRQQEGASAALSNCAENVGAPVFAMAQDWQVYEEHGRLIYQDEHGLADLDLPKLIGTHQIDNAGAAIAASRAAGLVFSDDVLSRGISGAHWPARMQRLVRGPLIDMAAQLLGGDPEIWLDGGHNPHAGRALAQVLADMADRNDRPLVMIAGLQMNKDLAGYLEHFSGLVSQLYAVSASVEAAAPAEEIEAAARQVGLRAQMALSVTDAMRDACLAHKENPPRFFIGGSLYLAGEILSENS